MDKEQKAYIKGIEDGINWLRQDMGGGALRLFDLHSWKIFNWIKEVKKTNKINK